MKIWCILHNVYNDRYHSTLVETSASIEPGKVLLRSKLSSSPGSESFEEELTRLHQEAILLVPVPSENIFDDEPLEWDGVTAWRLLVPQWRKGGGKPLREMLKEQLQSNVDKSTLESVKPY